jgi:glutamyl-tRNA(Gln) amidotransferase subunit E
MDYKQLGLRVGLEIHQQLNSGSKLFCRCPLIKSDEFPLEVKRKMIPVQSELGEEDPAALFEFLRDRTFVYRFNKESSCLLELDEMPPLEVNRNALETSLKISRLLNCNIVDEIHFMRKTVIDGSAVSGFQRTGLISVNGYIDTSFGKVGVQTIGLEEDSAPAYARGANIEYRLDRLGTPMVEIATAADMHTPEQAKEVAEKIGSLLRATDVVRGIGSIRQDVNISIAEGARVEIKGFQELDKMMELVDNEVARQATLIEIKNELRNRHFTEIKNNARDVTQLFHGTKCNFVRKAIESGQHVSGLKIEKFSGLLTLKCGDRTLGKELSAYPASHGFGIIHSDEELSKYSLVEDFAKLREELNAADGDLILIVVGNNSAKAIDLLVKRINYMTIGVPEETRIPDGIGSKYARPLPGSGRLYPESDVPAILVTGEMRNIPVPKTLEERKEEFKELPEEMRSLIVKSQWYEPTRELSKYGENLAANLFLSNFKDLKRKGFDVDVLLRERFDELDFLLLQVSQNKVPRNAINEILIEMCSGMSAERAIAKFAVTDDIIMDFVKKAIKENPGKSDSAIIGIVLSKVRADGKKVAEMIKKLR